MKASDRYGSITEISVPAKAVCSKPLGGTHSQPLNFGSVMPTNRIFNTPQAT